MEKQYIEVGDGIKYYYKDSGKTILHRTDGPAVEYASGAKAWYKNGKRHRIDGPASEFSTMRKNWYVNGVFIFGVDKDGTVVERMR